MSESLDALERRIAELRAEVRRAVKAKENSLARSLRGDLRRAEQAWDEAITAEEPPPRLRESEASLLPIREQVHQALALLGVPTAAKLIVAVNDAFFSRELAAAPSSPACAGTRSAPSAAIPTPARTTCAPR